MEQTLNQIGHWLVAPMIFVSPLPQYILQVGQIVEQMFFGLAGVYIFLKYPKKYLLYQRNKKMGEYVHSQGKYLATLFEECKTLTSM